MLCQRSLIFPLALLISLAGCASVPARKPIVVPISTVINLVKDELQFVSDHVAPLEKDAGPDAACRGPGNRASIKLEPKGVKVILKTVAVKERNPSVGLNDPIGVISVDPSYSGAYSTGQTQSLAIELGFPPKTNGSRNLSVNDPKMDEHSLAQAIISFANGLLDVDHTKLPCLQPGTLTATTTFDVVNKATTGLTLKLWIFKLGEKRTVTDEAHQTIELAFDLKGSSTLAPPQ